MLRVRRWPFLALLAVVCLKAFGWIIRQVGTLHSWCNLLFSDQFLFEDAFVCSLVIFAALVLLAWWCVLRAGWMARGLPQGLKYLALSILLTPIFLAGLWGVPNLMQSDLRRLGILQDE